MLYDNATNTQRKTAMLKFVFFILFFALMVYGYSLLGVPPDTPYAEVIRRVWQGMSVVFIGAIGSLVCLHRISK